MSSDKSENEKYRQSNITNSDDTSDSDTSESVNEEATNDYLIARGKVTVKEIRKQIADQCSTRVIRKSNYVPIAPKPIPNTNVQNIEVTEINNLISVTNTAEIIEIQKIEEELKDLVLSFSNQQNMLSYPESPLLTPPMSQQNSFSLDFDDQLESFYNHNTNEYKPETFSSSIETKPPSINMNDDIKKQICYIEVDRISRIELIVNNKNGPRSDTFLHLLAENKQILHKVSGRTFDFVFGLNGSVEKMERLPTIYLMEAIIDSAIKNMLVSNDTALLNRLVNTKNGLNETPLHIAVKQNRPDFVRLLLTSNANPNNLASPTSQTALHYACSKGAYASFKVLMLLYYSNERFKNTINQIDSDGNTPLAIAIIKHGGQASSINNIEIIKELIEANVDTKISNNELNTCVHLLCQNEKFTITEILKIMKLLNITLDDLNAHQNIYGKTAWELWSAFNLFTEPKQLIEKLDGLHF